MEAYRNMNASEGRGYRNPMNQGCRQCDMQNRQNWQNGQNVQSRQNQQNQQDCQGMQGRKNQQNCQNVQGQQNWQSVQGQQSRRMYDGNGRSMEVECVCKVSKKDCHTEDAMAKLGECFPVVMAYVPWQQWGDLYDADCGLMEGTIFKDLNLIFCGVRC